MKKLPLYPNGIRSPLDTHVPPPSGAKGCTACDMHTAGIVSPIPICVVQNKAFLRGEATEVSLVVFEAPTRGEASGSSAASSATHSTVLRVIAALDSNILLSAYALRCCPGNRPVEDTHIEACRGHLLDAVNSLSRGYTITRIYAVGAIAHRALLGRVVSAGMIPHAVSTIYPCFAPQGIPIISLPDAGVLRRNIPSAQNAVLNGLSAIHTSKVDLAQSLTAPKDRNTHLVQSVEDHKSAFATIKKLAHVVFDTETVGRLHTPLFRVVSITFGGVTGASITYDGDLLEDHTVLNDFREFFTTSTAVKIGHNIKYDLLAIWCWLGVRVIGPVIDTRLDHKLISSTSAGDLATCAEMVGFGGHKNEARAAVDLVKRDLVALANADMRSPLKSGKPRKPPTLHYLTAAEVDPAHLAEIRDGADTEAFAQAYIDPRVRARYNALDVHATAALHRLNEQRLVAGRLAVAEEVVRPAILALTEMEATGLRVDVGALDIFTTYLESEIAVVQQRLAKYPGVNFSSPKQLAELLYDKLGLPVLAETPTGGRATGEEVLLALAEKTKHPLPKDVLAFRELEKLHGTYAEGMKKHIRYGDRGPRIHPSTLLDGAGCLPAGELVLTSRGYIAAEDVRVGDEVIAHTGAARRVVATCVNEPSDIYRVQLDNGLELRTTGDHKFLTGDNALWVRADCLGVGTEVLVHSGRERWAPIPDWGAFEVSSWGRVRNTRTGRLLALHRKGRWGHLKVQLYRNGAQTRRDGDRKDFAVHRLVLNAFGTEAHTDDTFEVRHLNGIAWDNTIGNLTWGTSAQNKADAQRHGTRPARATHGFARLTEADVARIRSMPRPPRGGAGRWGKDGVSDTRLAKEYGLTREAIRDIRSGKRWKAQPASQGPRAMFNIARVVRVVREPPEPTYGATVDTDHSHVTGGVVTHNTGRLSSQNPNMQNVPSPDRDKPGRPAFGKMARDIFIADPGCVLLEVDMSQQELRIAGMLSGDPVILECYQRGEDIHRATAAVVYGVAPEAVSKEQRSRSKTVTFGLLYGKTDRGLSKQLNITVDEARRIRQAVLGRFKHLAKWCEDMLSQARRDGGVFTWWNGHAMARWRELPAINDQTEEGFGARINAENAAVNTPIQGLAADIVTASLYPIVHRFHKEGVNAQLVNTVHDSVMVNVALEDLPRAARIMREVMTGHNTMGFPLAVDMKSGPSWGSMSEYHPPG